ncbi:MAG: cation-transporting P-type ATPase, partial [Thermosynechococcaceae cyanobacterium]
MITSPPIWSLESEDVYSTLDTQLQGLSASDATQRQQQYGPNELPEPPRRSL